MKQWFCIQVDHHERVGDAIEVAQEDGWNLHTYSAAGPGGQTHTRVNHYRLFVREASEE